MEKISHQIRRKKKYLQYNCRKQIKWRNLMIQQFLIQETIKIYLSKALVVKMTQDRVSSLKCQNLENMNIEEFKVNTDEFQEESAYISRRFRSRKAKKNRTKAECRIRALRGMKSNKERESEEGDEAAESSTTIYNRFVVVKSSFDPQQDFRDSMVEMIKEKGIKCCKELQELLACYLTLNCDRHHDLIINAFQQVWFQLSCFEEGKTE